jgi:PAS domain S-box-containing protein
MVKPSDTDAALLQSIIAENEEWLIDRILAYAKRQGYTRYTSTLREAWRQSVAGLSASIVAALKDGIPDLELTPEEDCAGDPMTRFGIHEADLHRQRGVALGMFLGLMKYYRQAYLDLIVKTSPDRRRQGAFSHLLNRCFDRIEIGFVSSWPAPDPNDLIADLQRANRDMTNEKNKYLTIFESLQSPVAVLDTRGCIVTANHAWTTLFDGPSTPGTTYYGSACNANPPPWLAPVIQQCVDGRSEESTMAKVVRTAAGRRHLSIKVKRMLDVSDKFRGCVIVLDDITRQQRTEAALQESTIWLTEMFNALEDAVFIAKPSGRIVDSNLAAQRIFGYTDAELKNQSTEILHMDRDHYEAFMLYVRETLAKGGSAAFEYTGRRKNGDLFPTTIHIALLRKADHTPMGIVCVVRDLTVLKEAEAAAHHSARLQGALELAGAVCHDLNQPLMAITGYAELILLECPDDAPHAPLLNKIVDQVAKVGAITKKLMRVTRYETKTYLNQQIIDIDKASR